RGRNVTGVQTCALPISNEKLNISKLAFPLVNPSMLRRLFFRFIEVYPNVTNSFVCGYGRPADSDEIRKIFKNEYLLPNFIRKDRSEERRVGNEGETGGT